VNEMELMKQIELEVKNGSVTEYSDTEAALSELESTYGSEVPDCSTKEGYERSKKISGEMIKLRTGLESKRKVFKSPVLALGKMIDSEAKVITSRIVAIEEPHKLAYREVDEEKKRIKLEIEYRIIYIKDMVSRAIESESPEVVEAMINELAEYDVSKEKFGRRVDEVAALVASTLEELSGVHAKHIEREQEQLRIEAERAELDKLRKDAEEREAAQQEIEKQAKREAEEALIAEEAAKKAIEEEKVRRQSELDKIEREKQQAKLDAEEEKQRRIQQEKDSEAARIKAEQQAKLDAEEAAERARLAEVKRQFDAEQIQKAEQEKRESNRRHVGKVRGEAKESLIAIGVSEEQAKEIVLAISKGQINNVSIHY